MTDDTHQLLIRLKRSVEEKDVDTINIFLEQLYIRFSDQFFSFAQSRGLSFEDAEEVANDTFTRVCYGIHTYKENGKAKGKSWIWTICRHQVIDKIKMRRKEKTTPFELISNLAHDVFSSERWSPVHISETNELYAIFREAWECMTRAEQEEILKREHTRGTKGEKWEAAWHRFCTIFKELYRDIQ